MPLIRSMHFLALSGSRCEGYVVQGLRQQAGAAGGLVVACPEYVYGLPGSVQNALDWFVGSGDCPGNPVMLVDNARRA